MASSSWGNYSSSGPSQNSGNPSMASRSRRPQTRQLLSCTKCRERKVKCDRTKPCSACCARGHPRECEFIVNEGSDYGPIVQSYEIRQLRAENQRLRMRISALESKSGELEESSSKPAASRAVLARQRRFKASGRIDNLYFGTPELANIVHDFANLNIGSHSLTHTLPMPRPLEIYRPDELRYPFPVFHNWTGPEAATALLRTLPDHDELFSLLDDFQRRGQINSYPHGPDEVPKKEVERFLADADTNAQAHPDMLALIFAALATGLQVGEWDRAGGRWDKDSIAKSTQNGEIYIAASMQALRLASFMSQPTILAIQTLLLMGSYLSNSGQFLDAWTLFGTTIRLAHSIGLHRNPRFLDPTPPLRECMIRQSLWWWMLHLDQQYSVTLGRPLGISGMGDCPPPDSLTTHTIILRLGDFINHYTIMARQILSSDGMIVASKIDGFTDDLISLWETMPQELQWNESWSRRETILPEWPMDVISAHLFTKVQLLLILLNRQRGEQTRSTTTPAMAQSSPLRTTASTRQTRPNASGAPHPRPSPVRGRELVINSAVLLLKTFLYFYYRRPTVLSWWTVEQQAFHACMIVILDEWEVGNDLNHWLVTQVYIAFRDLQQNGVHKLANLAVKKISAALSLLARRKDERSGLPTQPMPLHSDSNTFKDWPIDTVMGHRGMFLLEDPGLQSYEPPAFQPLSWQMIGLNTNVNANHLSEMIASHIPVSDVSPAPFPVITRPFFHNPSYNTSSEQQSSQPVTQPHVQMAPSPFLEHTFPNTPSAPQSQSTSTTSFAQQFYQPSGIRRRQVYQHQSSGVRSSLSRH